MAVGDGMITMTPTSIAYSGTSATKNAQGGVDFTSVSSVSLNGVFTADYTNYILVFNFVSSIEGNGYKYRMRSSGVDATGTDYTQQAMGAYLSTTTNFYSTGLDAASFHITGLTESGCQLHVYSPYLTQQTAARSVSTVTWQTAAIYDYATTHSLASSYDGITIIDGGGTSSGTVYVFGYEE